MKWLRGIFAASFLVFGIFACSADTAEPGQTEAALSRDTGGAPVSPVDDSEAAAPFAPALTCVQQCGTDSLCVACCRCTSRGGDPSFCCY